MTVRVKRWTFAGQDYGSKTGKQAKQKPEEQEKVGEMSKSGHENSENFKGGGANMRPVLLFCPLKSNSAASSVSNIGIH